MDISLSDVICPTIACPVCSGGGRAGSLTQYHISLEERITMCNNDMCCYMDDGIVPDLLAKTKSAAVGTPIEPLAIPESNSLLNFNTKTADANSSHTATYHDPDTTYIMLWPNIDALCWMDVLLCNICHSNSMRRAVKTLSYSSVVKKLILTFDEAQEMLRPLQQGVNKLLHSVLDSSENHFKKGGGCCVEAPLSVQSSNVFSSQAIDSARRNLHLAYLKMGCAREEVWLKIEPQLKCPRGRDNSPVIALPVLLSLEKNIQALFLTKYSTSSLCSSCGDGKTTHRSEARIVNIPKPPKAIDLCLNQMTYPAECAKCSKPSTVTLCIDSYSSNMVMHFVEGLTTLDCDALGFALPDGRRYAVSAIVEYKSSPNHFTLWQRNLAKTKHKGEWMLYDDLQSQYGQFNQSQLTIPPHNVHMVFWECISPLAASSNNPVSTQSTTTTQPCDRLVSDSTSTTNRSSESTSMVVATPLIRPANSKSSSLCSRPRSFIRPLQCPLQHTTSSQPAKQTKLSPPSSTGSTATQLGPSPIHMGSVDVGQTYFGIVQSSTNIAFKPRPESNKLLSSSSAKKPARSYLDLVKPLLDKSKQKKSYSGYIPLSQRNTDPSSTVAVDTESSKARKPRYRQKKVQFTKDTRSRPSTPTITPHTPIPNNKKGKDCTPTPIYKTSEWNAQSREETTPVSSTSRQDSCCDMPDLDDLVSMFMI